MTYTTYIEELKVRLEKARSQRNERSEIIKELCREISRLRRLARSLGASDAQIDTKGANLSKTHQWASNGLKK